MGKEIRGLIGIFNRTIIKPTQYIHQSSYHPHIYFTTIYNNKIMPFKQNPLINYSNTKHNNVNNGQYAWDKPNEFNHVHQALTVHQANVQGLTNFQV